MFEKAILDLKYKGYIIQEYQQITKERQSSFWYDGAIATITSPNGQSLTLYAKIYEGKKTLYFGNDAILVFDGKVRDSSLMPFEFETGTDKDLENMNEDYYWGNGNWFSVSDDRNPQDDLVLDDPKTFFTEDIFESFQP